MVVSRHMQQRPHGYGDSNSDANCDVDGDPNSHSYCNGHADRHCDGHADCNGYSHRYPHCYCKRNGDADRDGHSDSNANGDSHAHSHSDGYRDTDCDGHGDAHFRRIEPERRTRRQLQSFALGTPGTRIGFERQRQHDSANATGRLGRLSGSIFLYWQRRRYDLLLPRGWRAYGRFKLSALGTARDECRRHRSKLGYRGHEHSLGHLGGD